MATEEPDNKGGPRLKTRDDDARGAPAGHSGNVAYEWSEIDARTVESFVLVAGQKYTAIHLGISESTLRKYYRAEIDRAMAVGVAKCGLVVYKAAVGDEEKGIEPDVRAAQWFLERRASETYGRNVAIEHSGVIQRGDAEIPKFDVSQFDAEQLRGVVPVLAALIDQKRRAELPLVDGADGRIIDN